MKYFAFVIMALFFAPKVFSQTEPVNYAAAFNKFKQYYNHDQPDSIFNMFSPEMKTAVPLDKFKTQTVQLKSQLGAITKSDFSKFNDPIGEYKTTFERANWVVTIALNSHNEFTGLFLKPDAEQSIGKDIPVDPSVTESPVLLKILSGSIAGTLTMPNNATGKIPVVLIIAGSGATDRNGNTPPVVNANIYKLLAYALGRNGIASVRYDKRMIGESITRNKESELTIDDYVEDAEGLINMLNDDQRFSKIIVAGHSEGSLIGILASNDEPVKGFTSLAGAGEPADKLLAEQMKSQPSYIADGFKRIIDSLRKGKLTDNVDPALYSFARPSIQPYLMSWCRYDPAKEIKKLKIPVLIIQGTTDLQVGVDNAQKLKSAKSVATLTIIRGMNHILKDAPPDKEQNAATYSVPDLPLNTQMVTAVINFIKGIN